MRLFLPSLIFLAGLLIYGFLVCWHRWTRHVESEYAEARRRQFDLMMKANEPPYRAMASRRQNIRAAGVSSSRKKVG